jgi:hypothetical protein
MIARAENCRCLIINYCIECFWNNLNLVCLVEWIRQPNRILNVGAFSWDLHQSHRMTGRMMRNRVEKLVLLAIP